MEGVLKLDLNWRVWVLWVRFMVSGKEVSILNSSGMLFGRAELATVMQEKK